MTGTIRSVRHQAGSGLAQLVVAREDGVLAVLPADAGPLIRAIVAAFPFGAVGQAIDYELDERGLLASFTPSTQEDA